MNPIANQPTSLYRLNTRAFASRFGVQPDTVRRGLCVKGHYLGVRPLKLPNGRNLWPDIDPQDLPAIDQGE